MNIPAEGIQGGQVCDPSDWSDRETVITQNPSALHPCGVTVAVGGTSVGGTGVNVDADVAAGAMVAEGAGAGTLRGAAQEARSRQASAEMRSDFRIEAPCYG